MVDNTFFKEFKEFVELYLLKKYRTRLGQKGTNDLRTFVRSCRNEDALRKLIETTLKDFRGFEIDENYDLLKKGFLDKDKKIIVESKEIKHCLEKGGLWNHFIDRVLEKKHIGDKIAKEIIFLCSLGRLVKGKKPYSFNALITSGSSAGKDHLIDSVLKLHPDSDVEMYGSMSAKALKHIHTARSDPDWTYDGKIVSIEEVNEKTMNDDVMKILTSAEKMSGSVADNRGQVEKIKGNPVLFLTSATARPTSEILNRFSVIGIDESEEQTKRTFSFEEEDYHQGELDFIEGLKMCRVNIPFTNKLREIFPSDKVKYRRYFQKLLDYIRAIAILHQENREHHKGEIIDAEWEDYDIAREPFMNSCSGAHSIPLKEIDKRIVGTLEKSDVPLSATEISKFTEKYITSRNLYNHLKDLANKDVLETFDLTDSWGNAVLKYVVSEEYKDKTPIKLPDSSSL
ncbi:MAG: hypothetical protein ABIB47_01305 [Candidatus Woesearchaeota archaeon]